MNKHTLMLGLLLFNGLSAIGGGIYLMSGAAIPEAVKYTDFPSLYFPGVILMAVVGGSSLIAAIALMRRVIGWEIAVITAAIIMWIWIIGEIVSIRSFHILQLVYIVTAGVILFSVPQKHQ